MDLKSQLKGNILDEINKQLESQIIVKKSFPSLEDFLLTNFCTYGEDFTKRLEQFGCTEMKDDKLSLQRWHKEFASGIADLRLYHVLTTGNAQCGKSLFNTLFMVDFLVFVGINLVWFYPSKTQVDNLVPGMFGRVVRSYVQNVIDHFAKYYNKKLELIGKQDRTSNSVFQVRGASAYFRYASTSGKDHTEQQKGLAVVGGSASSISANILFIDERSQIQPEAVGTLFRRLDAARLPGGLIREIGTPGSGLGIEALLDNTNRHFYPHIVCPHCKNLIRLDPKGCLLKPLPNDPNRYLSSTGRPVDWFYKDPDDKIESAYFACYKCKGELADSDRLNAHFRCLRTEESWRSFQAKLPNTLDEAIRNRYLVAFHLSPLLRQTKFNLAVNIIKEGCGHNNTSPRDFQQQMLGHKSESDTFAITKDMLRDAIVCPYPQTKPTCIVAGIDQGRGSDYVTIAHVWVEGFQHVNNCLYYESDSSSSPIMRIEKSHRRVVYCGSVHRKTIPALLKNHKVDFAIADNEPDIAEMYTLAKNTCIELADQKTNLLQIAKEITVFGGSLEIPAYAIYADYFKDSLLSSFVDKHVSFFDFDLNDKTQDSIVRHLCSCEKDPVSMKWERPGDKNDDLFFSSMFMEAALFIYISRQIEMSENTVAWFNNIDERHISAF